MDICVPICTAIVGILVLLYFFRDNVRELLARVGINVPDFFSQDPRETDIIDKVVVDDTPVNDNTQVDRTAEEIIDTSVKTVDTDIEETTSVCPACKSCPTCETCPVCNKCSADSNQGVTGVISKVGSWFGGAEAATTV